MSDSICRALIIRKPWLDLILSGQKTWEMRSRNTNITGWIGLIEQGTGLIVGRVFLTGCYTPSLIEIIQNHSKHRVVDLSLLKKWRVAWQLERAERFDIPIRYSHPKGAVTWVKIEDHSTIRLIAA